MGIAGMIVAKPVQPLSAPSAPVHSVTALRYTPLLEVLAGRANPKRCQGSSARSTAMKPSGGAKPAKGAVTGPEDAGGASTDLVKHTGLATKPAKISKSGKASEDLACVPGMIRC